jgi:hypothetical protein
MVASLAAWAAPGGSAAPRGDVPVDLAAMILTPADLADAGLEEFGPPFFGDAPRYRSLGDAAAQAAGSRGLSERRVTVALRDAGWEGQYTYLLQVLSDPEALGSPPTQGVAIEVTAYGDADGAAAAFAYHEQDNPPSKGVISTPVRAPRLGDGAELTLESAKANGPVKAMKLAILTDRFVATLRYSDETKAGFGSDPDTAVMRTLGKRLLDRMDAAVGAGEPGLSVLSLRLDGNDGNTATKPRDEYEVLDGEPIPYAGMTAADRQGDADRYRDAGITHLFHHTRYFYTGDTEFWAGYNLYLTRYGDKEAAHVGLVAESGGYTGGAFEDAAQDETSQPVGDEAMVVSFSRELDSGKKVTNYRVWARVGAEVVLVSVSPQVETIPVEVAEEIVAAQADCLAARACEAMPIPAGLLGPSTATQRPPKGDPGPKQGAGDAEVYESPNYGYRLTYDPQVWQVMAEDDDPSDPYDRIDLNDGVSTFSLMGNPDFGPDQLAACVKAGGDAAKRVNGVTGFKVVPGSPGEEDGRAYAEYAYTFQETDFIAYVECRDLGNVTVLIFQTAGASVYDGEVAAREDLLAGLEPGRLGGFENAA